MVFKQFRADKWYLPKVHLTHVVVISAVNLLLASLGLVTFQEFLYFLPVILLGSSVRIELVMTSFALASSLCLFQYGWDLVYPIAMLAAMVVTFPLTGLLHNTSHGNIRPRWFGRMVGELCGLAQLSCYSDWAIIHVLHHAHTDDMDKDPHPPSGLSYLKFVFGVRQKASKVFATYYLNHFGQTPEVMRAIQAFSKLSKIRQFSWVLFWFLALGPKLFAFGFVFSIMFKMYHYAWLNWRTHMWKKDGTVEIMNLNHGIYKLINLLSSNLYYHQNHHINMTLADPKKLTLARESARKSA